MNQQVEIDYRALALETGDTFVLATDGVYEHVNPHFVADTITAQRRRTRRGRKNDCAKRRSGKAAPITSLCRSCASTTLPGREASEIIGQVDGTALPAAARSAAWISTVTASSAKSTPAAAATSILPSNADGATVALKTPSIDLRNNPAYLRRFTMEEWVARRIDSPHVLRPRTHTRRRNYLYVATEFIEGQTLTQWMIDNPKPAVETVRDIVEQIANGLQAFHRMEMLHQDLRPENVMIDKTGTAKIIDFGSTRISGIADDPPYEILGTVQYTAPEYFLGEAGSQRSDIFSLGVIAYQMLTGALPYGAEAAKARTKSQQRKLKYRSALDDTRAIPAWIDGALKKAVDPDPLRRYGELSEFLFDLRHPNKSLQGAPRPLMERNPLLFWKSLAALLFVVILVLLVTQYLYH